MAMAANNAENEITNATLKSVVHISAPQVAYAQTYSANFYSGSQHFTSLLKTFRETGQVLSHHQTFVRYRNGKRFF